MVFKQITFLRAHVAQQQEGTGLVTPDLRVMRELGNLCKLHSSLCSEHKKRMASKT